MKLVYHIVHRYFPKYSQDEDIIQVGMIGLCYAAETWDETKGLFSTYGGRCVHNNIILELKYRGRKGRSNINLSLDYPAPNSEGDEAAFGDFIVGDYDVEFVDLQSFYDTLNTQQQQLFDLLYIGVSPLEIARKLDVSHQTIYQRIRLLRTRWKEFYGS